MSLFGNLPPPLETENDEEVTGHQPEPKENSSRSWARPELVPNLRRPKVAAKPRNADYNPAMPNNYQEYAHWIECRQVRDQAQPVDDGSSSERDEGERLNPSSD
ncbi:hypothetical protein H4R23_004734 [Coemansia sp. Cherry 401B]|nr:hypothetical protein H4R23_004734 [Coemansia sp. Cherry 401B]